MKVKLNQTIEDGFYGWNLLSRGSNNGISGVVALNRPNDLVFRAIPRPTLQRTQD